jgi:cytochrome c oxidase subunit 2
LSGRGRPLWSKALPAAAAACLLASCSRQAPSILDPGGPAAQRVTGLWWLLFWVSAVVFAVVIGLMAVAILRRGRAGGGESDPTWGEPFIRWTGVFIPVVVLAAAFLISLKAMSAVSAPGHPSALTIRVTGHMWWWEVRYPGGVVTANEIHVPVGEPVLLKLDSADVIHSFWVPQLQVKADNIPGKVNPLWIRADLPGTYRGQCAEYCGLQHAQMVALVIAQPKDGFEQWLAD